LPCKLGVYSIPDLFDHKETSVPAALECGPVPSTDVADLIHRLFQGFKVYFQRGENMPVKQTTTKASGRRLIAAPGIKKRPFPQKNISKIAGCLSTEDAVELKSIIEKGCERIDHNAWKNMH
jgi:hypothetical protein